MEKDAYTEWIWTFSWACLIIKHATLWKDGVCGQEETLVLIGLLWKLKEHEQNQQSLQSLAAR